MADVIRKAIIELELRHKGGGAGGSGGGGGGAFAEVTKATKEVERASKEATRATTEFGFRSAGAFREAGEGALRLARGLAFLSASGSEDMKKLTQTIAAAAGAFDIAAGSLKIVSNISRAFGTTAAAGVGVVTAAVVLGTTAWQHYRAEAQRAAEAAQLEIDRAKERAEKNLAFNRQGAEDRAGFDAMRARFALTPESRLERINAARTAASVELMTTNDPVRQRAAAERGAELQRQQYEVTVEMLEAQKRQELAALKSGGPTQFVGPSFSTGDTASAEAAITEEHVRQLGIFTARTERALDQWANIIEEKTRKIREIESAQEQK